VRCQIQFIASGQVIENSDFYAFSEEPIHDVAAYEACASGYKNFIKI
jgi:hypothetical protein